MGRADDPPGDDPAGGTATQTETAPPKLAALKAEGPGLSELVAADEVGGYQVVGTYADAVIANLARAKLTSVGIRARLRDEETVSIEPLLAGAVGGVKVVTLAADAADARAILEALDAEEDEHEADDALEPRCPECDSPYLRNVRGKVRCQRCGYKGTIDAVMRRAPYRAGAGRRGDPVFRLVRRNTGLGVFVGLVLAAFFMMLFAKHVVGAGAWVIACVVFVTSVFFGHRARVDLCSRPKCRTRLAPGATVCPACGGHVEGEIHRAQDHHARRAAWLKGEAVLPRR